MYKSRIRMMPRALLLGLLAVLVACSDSSDNRSTKGGDVAYNVDLYRTEGGAPHVVAEDWGSVGFGTGYFTGQDNVCAIARNNLKLRAQLSEYFGPDDGNRNSDFFYANLLASGIYDAEIDPELEDLFAGYAAGFNRYLRDTGIDNLPDLDCQGAAWVQQMSLDEVRRVHLLPAFLPNFIRFLYPTVPAPAISRNDKAPAAAQHASPVTVPAAAPGLMNRPPEITAELLAMVEDMTSMDDKGSNGVAIGRDLSVNQSGLLYTNPHLGTDLTFRFAMMHQIMPGVMNMLGANAYNRANVGFGTNGDVAWTNTVSASLHFNWYRLDLVPGDPFSYLYDGEVRPIEPSTVTIKVKTADGSLVEESYTFYSTHYGPMVGFGSVIFPWGPDDHAYTLSIADEGARTMQGASLAYQRAETVRELKDAFAKYAASPSTNIVAADSSGDTLYIDSSPTVNFSDQQLVDCVAAVGPLGKEFSGNGEACEWRTDEDSAAPGLVGASNMPFLFRTDYVTNSNDTYWLTNPAEPVTGALMVYGGIEDERTLRTRSGLHMIMARQDGRDDLPGNLFDIDSIVDRMLSNQHFVGQVLRDDLVTLCENNPLVEVEGATVDISEACPILADWDLASNLDSRGSHLFREFLRAANEGENSRLLPESLNYTVPFSVEDPVATPRGLTQDNPVALQSLAIAIQVLRDADVALDARLGDIQSVTKNEDVIPWHGGEEWEGVFNKMSLDFVAEAGGYPAITGSSASWIMAVEFGDQGLKARGNLTYSQSLNPTSAHYSDMTKLFSGKQLVDLPYELEEVKAAATDTMELSEGAEQCEDGGWGFYQHPAFADEDTCRDYFQSVYDNRLTDYVDD
jgi:acyl-homoserine-lactone acylase